MLIKIRILKQISYGFKEINSKSKVRAPCLSNFKQHHRDKAVER